jgi:DNA-binding transcriptional regulator LsrR (DeoR family)
MTQDETASPEAAGTIGDAFCHVVNEAGEPVRHPVNDRVMAVNPVDLRFSRDIIPVSGGWHKLKIITASLKPLKPSLLIVNELVAERLAATPA